jgi:hypothetical protein
LGHGCRSHIKHSGHAEAQRLTKLLNVGDVPVCVDEAWNQGAPGSVNHREMAPHWQVPPERANDSRLDGYLAVLENTFAIKDSNVRNEEARTALGLGKHLMSCRQADEYG